MSENQEKRKWIMLRKAEVKRSFTTNIIPKFINEKDNYTAKDDFGEWTIRLDNYSNSSLTSEGPNLSAMFDHDENTYCCIRRGGYSKGYAWFYVELPNRVSIAPSKISVKAEGNWQKTYYVQGYNPTTKEWETITDTLYASMYDDGINAGKVINFTVNTTATQTFYTKFRMHWHDQYAGGAQDTYIWSFEITEGIIRKL